MKLNQLCVIMLFLSFCVCGSSYAQKVLISGKLIDQITKKPVAGASVLVKEGSGAMTDSLGRFRIHAIMGQAVSVSALNYVPLVYKIKKGGDLLLFLMPSTQQLSDVIVTTALGIQRNKSTLGYSTQQISDKELNVVPSANFVNNLEGKVSGVTITSTNRLGGSNNIIIRGMKSLTQSNQALFIIDGVPVDNTDLTRNGIDVGSPVSDLDPNDIESLNILKGAAATALYGSRGSNGVIIVTTKKGSAKNSGYGVSVNSSFQFGTLDHSTLPTYQKEYGEGFGSAGYSSSYPSEDGFFYYLPTSWSSSPVEIVQTDVDQATGPAFDKTKNVYQWDAFSPTNANYGKATPWVASKYSGAESFFETPLNVSNNIMVEKGYKDGSFKMGYTNNYIKGMVPNAMIMKNQFDFAAVYKISNNLTLTGSILYVNENGRNRDMYSYNSSYNAGSQMMTDFRQWWAPNLNLHELKDDFFRTYKNVTWNWLSAAYTNNTADATMTLPAYHNNPYWNVYMNYNNDARNRYLGSIKLDYKITDYLSLMGRVAKDYYSYIFERRNAMYSVNTAFYDRYNASVFENNYDLMVNFNKNVTPDFNLKALIGGNVRQNRTSSIYATTDGGLKVEGLYSIANSENTPAAPSEYEGEREVDGIFGDATITWKELVTLEGTIRRDRSSTLAIGHNTYYYPSVSGNFVYSKLLPDLKWLSFGKLRASYAEVGGDAPIHSLKNTFTLESNFNSEMVMTSATTMNNADLLPERTKSYEVGLENEFFNGRIGLDLTYYYSRTNNQIMPVSVSPASGYYYKYVNGGAVRNKGLEVTLNLIPIKTRDFSWNATINWNKNMNKVLSLTGGVSSYTIGSFQNSISLIVKPGQPYGIIRGSDYVYVKGKREVDDDGYYVTQSSQDIGNITPDWKGSINNSFRYKSLTFSFLIDVQQGGDLYSLDLDYGSSSGLYPKTAGKNDLGNPQRNSLANGGGIIEDGVHSDGTKNTTRVDESDINEGDYTYSSDNNEAAKSYVYKASFVKLRELSIAYSLPQTLITKLKYIKGVDVALTGKNLWIIHKDLPYSDPEEGQGLGNSSIGYQNGAMPTERMYGVDLKLKF